MKVPIVLELSLGITESALSTWLQGVPMVMFTSGLKKQLRHLHSFMNHNTNEVIGSTHFE